MRASLRGAALLLLGGCCAATSFAARPTVEERRDEIDRLLEQSGDGVRGDPVQRAQNARLALEHLATLLAATPNDPQLHWLAGQAWMLVGDEGGSSAAPRDLVEKAIAAFETSRRLEPDGPLAERTATDLGILRSKLGEFERALAEYDRALAERRATRIATGRDDGAANLEGNSAETLMALGRLDEAIARYRAAVELSAGDPRLRALALYGLAVALDRDEQAEKSREAMRHALSVEQQLLLTPLAVLRDPDVFFMPLGEQAYYEALGHLALGNERAATDELRQFLSALPQSRWAGRARRHLAELEAGARDRHALHLTFGAVISPPRDGAAIARMLQRSEERLKACFGRDEFLEGNAGELVVAVGSDGRVARLDGVSGQLGPDLACAGAVARSWRFGPGAGGRLAIPVELGR
jgi:tetratricopeptide (TPR) repeat protein